ncbi:unnamed protein product, partial [marine sediment metagenome]
LNFEPNGFLKLFDPEFLEIVKEQATKKQLGQEDTTSHYEIKCVKKTGEKFWVENYSKTINYKGKPADFVTNIEITERKKAEQKLKESEEKFRKIAEQSFMGIAILQDDVFKYINGAYVKATGYSKKEMLNWKPNEYQKLVHPEFLPLVKEQVRKKQQGEIDDKSNYYYKGIRKDGQEIWTELYSKSINYNGRPADLITRIDRTEQKIAEEALKESEEKFRKIAEQSFMGIYIIQDGLIVYRNQRAVEVGGYSNEEIQSWKPDEYA